MAQRKKVKYYQRKDFDLKKSVNPFKAYLNDMGRHKILDRNQELECTKTIWFYRPRLIYNLCMLSRYENDLEDRLNEAYLNNIKSNKDLTKTKKDIFINNLKIENWEKLKCGLDTANKLNETIENLSADLKKSKKYRKELKSKIKSKKEKKFWLFKEFYFSRSFSENLIKYTLSRYFSNGKSDQNLTCEKKKYVENLSLFYNIYSSAFEKLINSNLRLVISVAKKYANYRMSFQDLIQEGNKGLIKAIERFDFSFGNKLSTFATWWIRQSVTRSITEQSRIIFLPTYIVDLINKINKNYDISSIKKNGEDLVYKIAKKMDESPENINKIIKIMNRDLISTEMEIGEGHSSLFKDFMPDENSKDALKEAHKSEIKKSIEEALETIRPREKLVLCLRFGIGYQFHTLEKAGELMGITRERVRQIEKGALKKLQHPVRSKKLKNLLDTKYL